MMAHTAGNAGAGPESAADPKKLPPTEQPAPRKAVKPPKPRKVEKRRRGRKG